MSELIEVKTSELTGAALDWAVAQVEGVPCYTDPNSPQKTQFVDDEHCPFGRYIYSPRQNWAQCGPLLISYRVQVSPVRRGQWLAMNDAGDFRSGSPLTAICRAIVAAKLGDVVLVPAVLVEVVK